MLARRQELNTQIQQLIDSFLLAFSLLAAHTLRFYSTRWFNLTQSIDPFGNYSWLLIVVMLFGPILLDVQGFYESPFDKSKWKSFVQIVRAMIYLSIIVSACVIFLRLPLASRSMPPIFIALVIAGLLVKERLIVRHIRRRALRGELREPVLLAGSPQDITAFEETFSLNKSSEWTLSGE